MKDFREMKVWKKSRFLLFEVFKISEAFPKHEFYGLTNQIRNSCIAIPANIVRGFCRGENNELVHFFQISMNSVNRLENHLRRAHELCLLNNSEYQQLKRETTEIMCMLGSFIQTLNPSDSEYNRNA